MTTTQNPNHSVSLPLDEILFLLNRAEGGVTSDIEQDRIDSLRAIVSDADMPVDSPKSQIFLLLKANGGYDAVTVCRAFADEAEAVRTMEILNEFSSDNFEVQSVIFES